MDTWDTPPGSAPGDEPARDPSEEPAGLAGEIEAAFARHGEPALPGVEQYVAAGRRRLRRRRVGAGAAVLGTAAAVVAAAVLAGSGTPQVAPDRTPVAEAPSPEASAAASPAAPPVDLDEVLSPGQVVGFDAGGELVLRPGWQVVRRVANPLRLTAPATSLGVVVRKGKQEVWALLEHEPSGGGASWDPASKAYARYEDWLASQVALAQSADTPPEAWVELERGSDRLVAVDGVTLVEQRLDPDVPGFAEPGDRTAAVKVTREGRTWFVLVRLGAGVTDNVPVDAAILPEPTMAAFLAYARSQYASGSGLR